MYRYGIVGRELFFLFLGRRFYLYFGKGGSHHGSSHHCLTFNGQPTHDYQGYRTSTHFERNGEVIDGRKDCTVISLSRGYVMSRGRIIIMRVATTDRYKQRAPSPKMHDVTDSLLIKKGLSKQSLDFSQHPFGSLFLSQETALTKEWMQ